MTTLGERDRVPFTDPARGEAFTDHLISLDFSPERGWGELSITRLADIELHPGTVGLHYGQVAFEGLKAHRQVDGSMVVFRPRDNARRFQRSARRMAMPELPEQLFIDAIDLLVRSDSVRLSDNPLHSMYLRPLMFGSDVTLMPRPSRNYRFLLMAFIAAGFFGDAPDSLSVFVNHDFPRAFPGGTGDVKVAGNYGQTLIAQQQAEQAGCQQVVWLDAEERRYLEEMSGMNLFLVRGSGPGAQLVTPKLNRSFLPGITRDSILRLAQRQGYRVSEERIELAQWRQGCQDGTITEAFVCGTAAVMTPIGRVRDQDGEFLVGDGRPGPVTRGLRGVLVDLQHGLVPDPEGWLHVCQ